ncbi:hypothetical protein F511_19471 [Dorcoceras hygrometricum]|uniref:Uncharacterized protein n=1 Tax=Dorcoceras hygrometricum TaxID=472368 RepID=A0A2Z7DK09_9LAMI|nr:hypothetical protein F511_19471 [Dorcoceras hygrometricum]
MFLGKSGSRFDDVSFAGMRCIDDVSLAVEEVWSLVLFFLDSVFCLREVLTTSFHERSILRCRLDKFMRWFLNAAVLISCYVVVFGSSTSERSVRSDERALIVRSVSVGCEGERRYRTLTSLLGSLATMRRVVNYHSSWARQRQVELFDASGIRVLYHGEWLITTLGTHPVATCLMHCILFQLECLGCIFGSDFIFGEILEVFAFFEFLVRNMFLGKSGSRFDDVSFAGFEGERRYRTLISLLGSLATMRRVVNYHSSWARQRQVELFDASGIRVLYHGEWLITTLGTHPVATVVADSWSCV